MSYSSLPENLPDATRQDRVEKILTLLREPMTIAVLASLGIHALLAVLLPFLPQANSAELDEQRTVKVVELTPTEQLQLPSPATSQLGSLPSSQSFSFSNPLVQGKPAPADPYAIPPFSDLPSYDLSGGAVTPLPIPEDPITAGPTFEDILRKLTGSTPKPRTTAVNPDPTPTPTPTPSPTETPNSTTEPQTSAPSPSPTAPPAPTRPEKIPQLALDRLRELQGRQGGQQQGGQQQGGQQQATGPTTTRAESNTTATGQADATSQLLAWLDQVAKSENIDPTVLQEALTKAKPTEWSVTCPIADCAEKVSKLPAQPAVWIAVDKEGKIIEPTAQVKTGDKDLDQAVSDELKNFESKLKATGDYQIYQLRVQYQPPEGQS